ncbi:tripartite tricarboxylate transporter TctB family protein [Maritimibacter dapengensis]|uniref:Tripartite tricarboxylate transporter TctB family protein n=1 Tax=Maritimibacter dapengensis TaxID=2836868 RepID=A0ABS6T6H8_9RHOB|nr:tripartite tricarboxylate transporter TctB family protein [Maritimibacter dapengensis]MBV7380810.1 tripartite tricarboxylate transporter TctB family protein [Maritimibacter dapengensis]
MNLLPERSRDILGGLALAVIGGGAALRAGTHLNLGSLGNMGPGFFPTILGVALALCGALIAAPALMRGGKPGAIARVNLRAILCVIGSVAVFALTIRLLGLVPSAFLAVVVAGFADPKTKLSTLVLLAIGLSVLSWLVFIVALGMPLSALPF